MNNNDDMNITDKIYRVKEKIEYFWDYYKIPLIIVLSLIIVMTIMIAQCAMRTEPDVNIIYIGPVGFYDDVENIDVISPELLKAEFEEILGDAFGTGKKANIGLTTYNYIPNPSSGTVFDAQLQANAKKQVTLEISTGQGVIYFLDDSVYDELKSSEVFSTFSYSLGYIPECASDGYHIKITDLPAYYKYAELGMFPENTVIAVKDYNTVNITENAGDKFDRFERNYTMLEKLLGVTAE